MSTNHRISFAALLFLVLGVVLAVIAPSAQAQDANPTYMQVFLTTVKSDRIGEFENLLKERAAGLAATGEGFRSVYQVLVGEQYRYIMSDFLPSMAALDRPRPDRAPPQGWGPRNDAATTAQTMLLMRRYPELRIVGSGDPEQRNLVRIRIRQNAPGRTQDYYEWQVNELLPALRKAGATNILINRVVLGGSDQTWVGFQAIDSMASTEEDILAESMGERQAAQMLARGNAMLVRSEDLIVRLRPDLGYRAE